MAHLISGFRLRYMYITIHNFVIINLKVAFNSLVGTTGGLGDVVTGFVVTITLGFAVVWKGVVIGGGFFVGPGGFVVEGGFVVPGDFGFVTGVGGFDVTGGGCTVVDVVIVGVTGGDGGWEGVVVIAVGGGAPVGVVVATGGHGTGHCAGHGCGTGQFGGITQGTHGG